MTSTLLRSWLFRLMILIIPAHAVAGAVSASCGTAADATQQTDMGGAHAGHHSMPSDAAADAAELGTQHLGCVLCASSCHGVSALISANVSLVPSLTLVLGYSGGYSFFAGQSPEPLKRPPRTVFL